MLDKNDQMAGGKPAGPSAAAKGATAAAAGGSFNGGGKMGASSSQSGGLSGGAMGSPGGSQNQGGMGSRSANAATGPGNYGGGSSNGGARGPTGPNGEARSNPGGIMGGGARGPTGPNGEPRAGFGSIGNVGAFSGNMRGPLGPHGELRTGITPSTRNYQNAEIARTAYPDSFGKYSQPEVTGFMGALAEVAPPEAYTNRYGPSPLGSIARVAINQVLAGRGLKGAMAALDSAKQRAGTKNLQTQGLATSGTPLNSMSQAAIQNAMLGKGLYGPAYNASNFTTPQIGYTPGAKGIKGTAPLGTYKGTTYRSDPAYTGAITAANKKAAGIIGGTGVPTSPAPDVQVASASPSFNVPGPSQPWERAQAVPEPDRPFNAAAYNGVSQPGRSPNMNMAGYSSPMASVGGMPPAQSNMNMAGYQSPMAGTNGMPQAPGSMNMAGYQSPMGGVRGAPGMPKDQSRIAAEEPRGPVLAGQGPGLLASPNINLPARSPNMDMAGYQSPMAGVGGLPSVNGYAGPVAAREGPYAGRAVGMPPAAMAGYQNPSRSFAGVPTSGVPAQQAPADPAQFANSPYGRAFANVGAAIGTGIGAVNKGMRQFQENKGLIGLANAVGVNPIGKAVKTAASQGIRSMQASLGGYSQPGAGATQMAASGKINPSKPAASSSPSTPAPSTPSPQAPTPAQQRATLMGMLQNIMGNGGPKTVREQKKVVQIAQAIQAIPTTYDYSVTERTI